LHESRYKNQTAPIALATAQTTKQVLRASAPILDSPRATRKIKKAKIDLRRVSRPFLRIRKNSIKNKKAEICDFQDPF